MLTIDTFLRGAGHGNGKLSGNIYSEKDSHLFFQCFRKPARKSKSKCCILEGLHIFFGGIQKYLHEKQHVCLFEQS